MSQKNQDEFVLPCGCVSMKIDGFGWKTILCEDCEENEESEYFTPQKVGKFRDQYSQ
ncbi:hypothetical protein GW796_05465 [archaeon]|nr:hypothetical protein [archaeon]NCQ51332.1 hypothetical protein [archaeon]NCT58842.1 hypothetical protein [archaeon]